MINKRLAKLEANLTSSAIDIVAAAREHSNVLAGIQGRVDALWWPCRVLKHQLATLQAQRQFRSLGGVLWSSSGKSADRWKSDERLRAELVQSVLITTSKSQGSVYLRLTAKAETLIRQLAGLIFIPNEILPIFIKVIAGKNTDWIREDIFFGRAYEQNSRGADWFDSEETIISLLTDGSLISKADSVGHVYYRVADVANCLVPFEGVEVNSAVRDAYMDGWESAMHCREVIQPIDGHEVFIPLPTSGVN